MKAAVGIIVGTGASDLTSALAGRDFGVVTRFGTVHGRLVDGDSFPIAVFQRHAEGHKLPPHHVLYLALAEAARMLGVRYCLASAAVGALDANLSIGSLHTCGDYIDVSARNLTRFDSEVRHTDCSVPFSEAASQALEGALGERTKRVCYVCANGPRYETPSEVRAMRILGGDVVGMTAGTEAVAFAEANIEYGCLAVITNLATGLGSAPLTHGDVERAMRGASKKCVDALIAAARSLGGSS